MHMGFGASNKACPKRDDADGTVNVWQAAHTMHAQGHNAK